MTALVTRCPQCGAAFRVVADQLRLRGGKVRCGICHAVFDARAQQVAVPASTQGVPAMPAPAAPAPLPTPARVAPSVQPVAPPAREPIQPATRPAPKPESPVASPPAQKVPRRPPDRPVYADDGVAGDDIPHGIDRSTPGLPSKAPVWHATPTPEPDVSHGDTPVQAPIREHQDRPVHAPIREHRSLRPSSHGPGPRSQEPVIGHGATSAPQHFGKREPVFVAARTASERLHEDERLDDPEFDVGAHDDVGSGHDDARPEDFVATRHAPRSVARRRRSSRLSALFWRTACVLAGVALVLQALWWWRTPLATYVPALRPVYESLCAGLGCAAGYVRRPSQLSIESSSMHPEAVPRADGNAQRMAMAALLRNRAEHPQPWPTIELSLTDFSDTVVVRRLIAPQEYLGPGAPPAFAGHSERAVSVSVTVRGIPVSGYRLALFFP